MGKRFEQRISNRCQGFIRKAEDDRKKNVRDFFQLGKEKPKENNTRK